MKISEYERLDAELLARLRKLIAAFERAEGEHKAAPVSATVQQREDYHDNTARP